MGFQSKSIESEVERKIRGVSGFSVRISQLIKFCLVGGTGVAVDMAVLALLADPKFLALNLTLGKICAAEVALANNFMWNELWTFRPGAASGLAAGSQKPKSAMECNLGHEAMVPEGLARRAGLFRRFLIFNAICGIGIGFSVLLLHLFHTRLGWNLYLSNLTAIILVTCWNFGMNARFNWGDRSECRVAVENSP